MSSHNWLDRGRGNVSVETAVSVINALISAAMILLLGTLVWMAFARNVLGISQPWLHDLARYLQIWVVFIAAFSLTLKNDHITMDAVYLTMTEGQKRLIRYGIGGITVAFSLIGLYYSLLQVQNNIGQTSASGVLPAAAGYLSVSTGFFLMAVAGAYFTLVLAGTAEEDDEIRDVHV